MFQLDSLPLRRQLLIVTLVALLGMILISGLAISKLNELFAVTNYTNENIVPTIELLNEANVDAASMRVAAWQSAAGSDADAREKALAAFFESEKAVSDRIRRYEAENMSFDTPDQLIKDKALVKAALGSHAVASQLMEQAGTLITQGKRDEAATLMWRNRLKLKEVSVAIDKIVEFNIELAKDASAHAAVVKKRTDLLLLSISILTAVVSLWLGLKMSSIINNAISRAVAIAENIASGTVGNQPPSDVATNEIGKLTKALHEMDKKLCDIVGSVSSTAQSVGSAARQIAQGNDDLSSRTQEQAAALEETAATMEQMNATVKRNADNARQADQLGRQARHQADSSSDVVQRAVGAMQEISSSSRKIGDIINVIDEIAFQTNLLALNAAVEAARAGEQGRGFAVVATEVRNLAQRSASAAKEIKELINDSINKVSAGTDLVNASGKALTDIVTDVKRVTDIVAEIAAASNEQSEGIDQINHAVTQMDLATQQNAALVEEAASASKSMEHQASDLVEKISFFRINGQTIQMSANPVATAKRTTTSRPMPKPLSTVKRTNVAKRVVGGDTNSWSEF